MWCGMPLPDNKELYFRTVLFWDVMHGIVVILCRCFGTTYRLCFQGSRNPKRKHFLLELLTFEQATDKYYQNVLPLYTA